MLKSLGCRAQEEREGGTEQGRRNIDRQTFYRYRGGEDWVGRDMKGRGGYKSFYNRWKYTEGMGRRTANNKWALSASTSEEHKIFEDWRSSSSAG